MVAVVVFVLVEAPLIDRCGEMSVKTVLVVVLYRGSGGELFYQTRERNFRMCCRVLDRG